MSQCIHKIQIGTNAWFDKNIQDQERKPVRVIAREENGLKYKGLYYVITSWRVMGPDGYLLCKYLFIHERSYDPINPNQREVDDILTHIELAGLKDITW